MAAGAAGVVEDVELAVPVTLVDVVFVDVELVREEVDDDEDEDDEDEAEEDDDDEAELFEEEEDDADGLDEYEDQDEVFIVHEEYFDPLKLRVPVLGLMVVGSDSVVGVSVRATEVVGTTKASTPLKEV